MQRTQLDFPKAGPCWARAALAHRKAGRDLKDHPDPTLRPSGIQYCPPHLCDPSSCAPDVCWGLISAGTRAEGSCKGGINQQEEQTIPRFKLSKPRILGRLERILPRKVTFGAVGRLGSHFRPSIIEGVWAEKRSRNKDHTTLSEVWGVQHSSATASCKTERGKVRKKALLSGALGLGLLQPARAAPGLGRNWDGSTGATL